MTLSLAAAEREKASALQAEDYQRAGRAHAQVTALRTKLDEAKREESAAEALLRPLRLAEAAADQALAEATAAEAEVRSKGTGRGWGLGAGTED